MKRSLRQIDSTVHWTHEITLGVVIRAISRARIEKVLSSLSVSELRKFLPHPALSPWERPTHSDQT